MNTLEGKTVKSKETNTYGTIIKDDTVRKTVIIKFSDGKSSVLSYTTFKNKYDIVF